MSDPYAGVPFHEPTLVRAEDVRLARGHMHTRLYGERASKSGDTDKIASELTIAKAIGRVLYSHYPGHPWAVEVLADQGIAKITIPPLLGVNWGYILHLDKLTASPQPIIEAGGHILERFNIPRSTIDIAAYLNAEDTIPLLGNFRASHRQRIPA